MASGRLLVVEDEIVVARDLQHVLERLGYQVVGTLATGEEALERVAALRPDLVLMDVHLAGELDGIQAAEQLRLRHALPVVFLTAHSDDATFHRAQGSEPFGYVLKPFEERELAIAVSIALYRHRVESKLAQMERWLATTLRSLGDAVMATDLAGTVTFMNEQAEALTGWSLAEARGVQLDDVLRLVQAADHAPVANVVERVLRENMIIELGPNTLLVARNGRECPLDNSAAPIRDSAGSVSGFVIIFRDITARKQAEEQLRYTALHDPLTSLANRALLLDRLAHAFEHGRRHPDYRFAVLYLDLDGFKAVNDRLGHLTGDQVLIGVARRLEGSLRGNDTVARLGGDEFVILLDSVADVRDAAHVAGRIQQNLAAPMHTAGREVLVGASIGIALNSGGEQQPEDILRDADAALYQAKALGKGRHVLSGAGEDASAMALLQLEGELRRAATNKEFCLHFQPIVRLSAAGDSDPGRLCGHEALLRWRHPERGLLPAAVFVELMEEMGLLLSVGHWVLRAACGQTQVWRARPGAGADLSLSVNLSLKQFAQPGLVTQVAEALAESGLAPSALCLEVPAGALLDSETALETLRGLRHLGVRLHLDGFGQGPIALDVLYRTPLDALKINAVALPVPNGQPHDHLFARTLLALARELALPVVAVGLETNEQASALRALGCVWGQGYLYGRPQESPL